MPQVKKALAELSQLVKIEEAKEEADDAEQLCDCKFSLAYGNKVLLNQTSLKLKRGYRYGLCGKNDSGKTTLMRAIADQQVNHGAGARTLDVLGSIGPTVRPAIVAFATALTPGFDPRRCRLRASRPPRSCAPCLSRRTYRARRARRDANPTPFTLVSAARNPT